MISDDELDVRLERAKVSADVTSTVLGHYRDAVLTRRSRRLRARIGACISVAVLAGGLAATPAAAEAVRHFFAVTDTTCQGTECGPTPSAVASGASGRASSAPLTPIGPNSLIDLSAPDLKAYIASQYPSYIVVPPTETKPEIVNVVQDSFPPAKRSFVVNNAIIGQYEVVSYCGWIDEWLKADQRSSSSRLERATRVLIDASTWPNIAQAGDLKRLQAEYVEGIRNGDRTEVESAREMYNCSQVLGN